MAVAYKDGLAGEYPRPSLPPAGPPNVPHSTVVAQLITAFDRVAASTDPVQSVANLMAVAVLELRRRSQAADAVRLRPRQKDELLRSLQAAYWRLWTLVSAGESQTELMICVRGCAALIVFWAETDKRRAARGEFVEDANDLALVLQTSMLNIALVEGVVGRANERAARRTETLNSLINADPAGRA